MQLLGIVWQAVWSRRWASLGIVTTAALGIAAAGAAPLWANGAEDSLVTRAVREADPGQLLVTVSGGTDPTNGKDPAGLVPATVVQSVRAAQAMPPSLEQHFSRPRLVLRTSGRLVVTNRRTRENMQAPVAWAAAGCERLVMTSGRCPSVARELVLSTRSARLIGVRVGELVSVVDFLDEPADLETDEPFPFRYVVVGLYAAPDEADRFWTGTDVFAFSRGLRTSTVVVPHRGDAAFVTHEVMTSLTATPVEGQVRRTLQLRSTRATDMDRVETALTAWKDRLDARNSTIDTAAPVLDTLNSLHVPRDAVRLGSYLLGVQLWLLAAYVLFLLSTSAAESWQGDIALAKLRGLRARRVALLGMLEPVLLVLLAAPLGLVLALGVTGAAVESALTDVDLRPDARFWFGSLVAVVASSAAGGIALVRALRQPLALQLRRVNRAAAVNRLLVGEVIVVTLAVAAFYQVAIAADEDRLEGIALVAPGLSAVAVAVVAARVLLTASVVWVARTRARPSVRGFLAVRQISRRHGGTRVAVLAAVAVSLATFALGTWQIAGQQRAARAAMEVGAPRVYEVQAASPTRLRTAVEQLNIPGDQVMAAVGVRGAGSTPPILGVDVDHLPSVAAWYDEWGRRPLRELTQRLRPTTPPSVDFRGEELAIDLDARLSTTGGLVPGALVATATDRDGDELPISFGRLPYGRATLEAAEPRCATGCTLSRWRIVRADAQDGPQFGTVTFFSLRVDGTPIRHAFNAVRGWRPATLDDDPSTYDTVSDVRPGDPSGVQLYFNAGSEESGGLDRADVPKAMPIAVVGQVPLPLSGHNGLVQSPVLGGSPVLARVVGRPDAMPRLGEYGVVADLRVLTRLSTSWPADISYQVWAGPGAPTGKELRAALRAQGLAVLDVESAEERRNDLSRDGPALALLLLLGVAVAGLGMAALATVALALVQARRRAYELAALRTAGVGDADLRGATLQEHLALLGTGLAFGLASGFATALLIGPAIGLLGSADASAPVSVSYPASSLVALGSGTLLLFAFVAAACARVSLRFSRPELLREAPA